MHPQVDPLFHLHKSCFLTIQPPCRLYRRYFAYNPTCFITISDTSAIGRGPSSSRSFSSSSAFSRIGAFLRALVTTALVGPSATTTKGLIIRWSRVRVPRSPHNLKRLIELISCFAGRCYFGRFCVLTPTAFMKSRWTNGKLKIRLHNHTTTTRSAEGPTPTNRRAGTFGTCAACERHFRSQSSKYGPLASIKLGC